MKPIVLLKQSFPLRFGNYLRNNCLPPHTQDVAVIEMASKAIARLTMVSGTFTANLKFELVDHEVMSSLVYTPISVHVSFFYSQVKRAFELLGGDRNEGKQYAAVLVLREIAFAMPTFFFQNVSQVRWIHGAYKLAQLYTTRTGLT